jgi:hypothetical protein
VILDEGISLSMEGRGCSAVGGWRGFGARVGKIGVSIVGAGGWSCGRLGLTVLG